MTHTTISKPTEKVDLTPDTLSDSVFITNNTQLELVVLDAAARDSKDLSLLYDRSLSLLSSADGITRIKAGETKVFLLASATEAEHTIILAGAQNLFPVKVFVISSDKQESIDVSVNAQDARLMTIAETFVQSVGAFPSSKMAADFVAVLATNDEAQIAAFFTAYPQYSALSLDHVVAVQTYYNQYGFFITGYASTRTFDIYTSNQGTTKKNLGTLTITNSVQEPVSSLENPAGFAATYIDQNHRKTKLGYKNGQLSDNLSDDNPKICLQAIFILLSQLSGLETDNRIVPAFYGTVNGAQVFGVSSNYLPAVSLLNATTTTSDIKDYFDSLGLWGWLKLAGIVVGAVVGITALTLTARYVIKTIKNPLLTPEEIKSLNAQKATKVLERMADAGVKLPEDLSGSLKDIKLQADANLLMDSKAKLERILQKQYNETVKMMEYGNSPVLQKTFESIDWDKTEVQFTTDSIAMSEKIDGIREHITQNSKVLADHIKTIKDLSTADAKMLTDAKELADRLTMAVDTNEKIREDLLEDEMPEFIEE